MAAARFRLQVKFWLDLHKAEENELADLIAELKQQRTFSGVVRDGIRLMVDLWRGNLDVLLALFPWVEDAFYERVAAQQPSSDAAIQEQLTKLERLLIEQGNQPISASSSAVAATGGGPKALAVPVVAGPVFNDDDAMDLVVKKAKSDGKSAQNFLDSAFSLLG
jgi:hypothetical protein